MSEGADQQSEYGSDYVDYLEAVWGEGFLSPGGAEEVARIVGGRDLRGLTVLDLGCGSSGAVLSLIRDHGAGRVVGAELVPSLLTLGASRAHEAGLADRVDYALMEAGDPLPFSDCSFDAVFSKDALIHEADKPRAFSDLFRILRPGGLLLYGDWLRGHDPALDLRVAEFEEAVGGAHMISLEDTVALLEEAGFVVDEAEDRADWYHEQSLREVARLQGASDDDPASERDPHLDFWERLPVATREGVLRPAHIRAHRPGSAS